MYEVILLPYFLKQLKISLRKHPDLKAEIIRVLRAFHKGRHQSLGNNLYKIRLSPKSLNRGKSTSFRLIVLVIEVKNWLVPMTLYFKGNKQNIPKDELKTVLEAILAELKIQ